MANQLRMMMPFAAVAFLLLCSAGLAADANGTEAKTIREEAKIATAKRVDDADLQGKWWPTGSAIDLQKMEPKDIEKIQIFRIECSQPIISPASKVKFATKQYDTKPLTHDDESEEIRGLFTLLKRAEQYKKPPRGVPHFLDHVLVVDPVAGEPFEILFSAKLGEPFGELYSLELKEALYALAGETTRMSIIHFDQGKVNQVIHHFTGAPHRGGVSAGGVHAKMHLSAGQGLMLYVKVREGKKVLMEDKKLMHYGDAKVFSSWGPDKYIVLLHKP